MLTYRGFSAWIAVDEQPLPEYLAAVDVNANRVSCWIPGEEGQNFTVWWQDHGGKVDTCSFIILDGLVVPGRFLCGQGVASRSGIRSSLTTEKPFLFTRVSQNKQGVESTNKEAGTIVVKVKRVKRVAAQSPNQVNQVGGVAALGQKAVGDLCVGFGTERPTDLQYPATWSVEPYSNDSPGSNKPSTYVSFVFRYRSAEFLEAQGIATEVKKTIDPKVGQKRRVASLPVQAASLVTPSPSPHKRPKLTEPVTLYDQGAFATRRTSAEARRATSWNMKGFPSQNVIFPRLHGREFSSSMLASLSSSSSAHSDEEEDPRQPFT